MGTRMKSLLWGLALLAIGLAFCTLLVKELNTGRFETHSRPALGGGAETHQQGSFDYNLAVLVHAGLGLIGTAAGVKCLIDAVKGTDARA